MTRELLVAQSVEDSLKNYPGLEGVWHQALAQLRDLPLKHATMLGNVIVPLAMKTCPIAVKDCDGDCHTLVFAVDYASPEVYWVVDWWREFPQSPLRPQLGEDEPFNE